jgi:hypothetical protein
MYAAPFRRKRRRTKLIENGRLINAEITEVEINKKMLINNMYPVRFVCGGGSTLYRSERIWEYVHPENWKKYIGSQVPIYIDPGDESEYYMDVSDIISRLNT